MRPDPFSGLQRVISEFGQGAQRVDPPASPAHADPISFPLLHFTAIVVAQLLSDIVSEVFVGISKFK